MTNLFFHSFLNSSRCYSRTRWRTKSTTSNTSSSSYRNCYVEYYFSLSLSLSLFNKVIKYERCNVCCFLRDTKTFFSHLLMWSFEFFKKSPQKCSLFGTRRFINLWRRAKREEREKAESHTFFEISLSLFFFFFVCGQLNFSRFSRLLLVEKNFTVVCF